MTNSPRPIPKEAKAIFAAHGLKFEEVEHALSADVNKQPIPLSSHSIEYHTVPWTEGLNPDFSAEDHGDNHLHTVWDYDFRSITAETLQRVVAAIADVSQALRTLGFTTVEGSDTYSTDVNYRIGASIPVPVEELEVRLDFLLKTLDGHRAILRQAMRP
ncbi:MAG: hypothetical protein ABL890_05165 [Candidatus Peribacteraceae bacterium]